LRTAIDFGDINIINKVI
jgi:hypothetical protein